MAQLNEKRLLIIYQQNDDMNQLVVGNLDEKLPNGNNKIESVWLGDMADNLYSTLTRRGMHVDVDDMKSEDTDDGEEPEQRDNA
jgi:hypothetical protein